MKYKIILTAVFAVVALLMFTSLHSEGDQEKASIEFSHEIHVEQNGMDCETCHAGVSESTTGADDLLPTAETCAMCHDDGKDPGLVPRITNYNVKFNHAAHISQGFTCNQCHDGISHKATASPSNEYLPDMQKCMQCHEVPEEIEGCYMCHSEDENLRPASHTTLWEHSHGNFRASKDDCMSCHSDNFCVTCHEGENLFNESHSPDFIMTHSLSFVSREKDCATCHEGYESCRTCHMEVNRILPATHMVPHLLSRHRTMGVIADQCVVCHAEDDPICAPCHTF